MQTVAERLSGGAQVGGATGFRVHGEDGSTGEPEQMIVLEMLGDGGMHLSELAAMTFIENQHHMLRVDIVLGIAADK